MSTLLNLPNVSPLALSSQGLSGSGFSPAGVDGSNGETCGAFGGNNAWSRRPDRSYTSSPASFAVATTSERSGLRRSTQIAGSSASGVAGASS